MITMPSLVKHSVVSTAFVSALALMGSRAHAGEWELDTAHASAGFSVKHMMISTVHGEFQKVSGSFALDDAAPTKSSVEIVIDASSINTSNAQRDGHLKSPDFFDVAKNPNITFKSTKIAAAGKGKYKVTGDLTMHGVTKPVVLEVEGPTAPTKDMMGRQVRGFSAKGKLNRKDWGLTYNKVLEAGGVAVSDEVQIQVDGELIAKAPAAAAPAAPTAAPAAAPAKK